MSLFASSFGILLLGILLCWGIHTSHRSLNVLAKQFSTVKDFRDLNAVWLSGEMHTIYWPHLRAEAIGCPVYSHQIRSKKNYSDTSIGSIFSYLDLLSEVHYRPCYFILSQPYRNESSRCFLVLTWRKICNFIGKYWPNNCNIYKANALFWATCLISDLSHFDVCDQLNFLFRMSPRNFVDSELRRSVTENVGVGLMQLQYLKFFC